MPRVNRDEAFRVAQSMHDAQEHPDCYAREPGEYPCIDCGADVGEWETFHTHGQYYSRGPRGTCTGCETPLCRACSDKVALSLGRDDEVCSKCARAASQAGAPQDG